MLWLNRLVESGSASKRPKEEIDEGTAIIQDVMKAWIAQVSALPPPTDGEDIIMGDEEPSGSKQARLEAEIGALRSCLEEARPRLEGNEWCKMVARTL